MTFRLHNVRDSDCAKSGISFHLSCIKNSNRTSPARASIPPSAFYEGAILRTPGARCIGRYLGIPTCFLLKFLLSELRAEVTLLAKKWTRKDELSRL